MLAFACILPEMGNSLLNKAISVTGQLSPMFRWGFLLGSSCNSSCPLGLEKTEAPSTLDWSCLWPCRLHSHPTFWPSFSKDGPPGSYPGNTTYRLWQTQV